MDSVNINFRKLCEKAIKPNYAHQGDAGLDVYSISDYCVAPGATLLVKTGIAIELPEGYEAQIRPRSGLALKHSVTVLNSPGTIDSGYRGEIGVIMINHGKQDFNVTVGMKIAQMVISRFFQAELNEVEELVKTHRGEGGFGSTGR